MTTDSTVSPLRQRMIEDMAARKLGRHTEHSVVAVQQLRPVWVNLCRKLLLATTPAHPQKADHFTTS